MLLVLHGSVVRAAVDSRAAAALPWLRFGDESGLRRRVVQPPIS